MMSFPTAQTLSVGMGPTASTVPDQTNPATTMAGQTVSAYSTLTGLDQEDQAVYLSNCGLNPDVAPSPEEWAECYQVNEGTEWAGPYAVTGQLPTVISNVPEYVWWLLGAGGALLAFQMLKK